MTMTAVSNDLFIFRCLGIGKSLPEATDIATLTISVIKNICFISYIIKSLKER